MAVGTQMNKTRSRRRRKITFGPGREPAEVNKSLLSKVMNAHEKEQSATTFLI